MRTSSKIHLYVHVLPQVNLMWKNLVLNFIPKDQAPFIGVPVIQVYQLHKHTRRPTYTTNFRRPTFFTVVFMWLSWFIRDLQDTSTYLEPLIDKADLSFSNTAASFLKCLVLDCPPLAHIHDLLQPQPQDSVGPHGISSLASQALDKQWSEGVFLYLNAREWVESMCGMWPGSKIIIYWVIATNYG